MIREAKWRGGSWYQNLSDNGSLVRGKLFQLIAMSGVSKHVLLPDARLEATGSPVFFVLNLGPNSFDLYDNTDSTFVVTIAADQIARVTLRDNTTQAGVWWSEAFTKLAP